MNVTPRSVTPRVAMQRSAGQNVVDNLWREFGRKVRTERLKHRWSQESCARRIEMTRQQWNRIEQGSGTKRATVIRIAEALELPANIVLGWAGFIEPSEVSPVDWERLRIYFSELPAETRAKLLVIAESLWKDSRRGKVQPDPPDDPFGDLFEQWEQ